MESSDFSSQQQSKLPSEVELLGSCDDAVEMKPSPEPVTSTTTTAAENAVSTSSNEDVVDAKVLPTDDITLEGEEKSDISTKDPGKLTSGIAVWMINNGVNNKVIDLIYWQDIKKSSVVFGSVLLILLFLAYHTLLTVISFFALSVLTVSLLYRIGTTVIGAVQKTSTGSPYKSLLENNIQISPETSRDIGELIGNKINCVLVKLTKLFLVEDIIASLKFAVFLWFMSCVGKWFNAVTLLILGTILLFSIPRLYEDNQTQVDQFLCKLSKKINEIVLRIKSKIEGRFKKQKAA